MADPRYPIGVFSMKDSYTPAETAEQVRTLMDTPSAYRRLTERLDDAALAQTYREGAWNVRQLVHHVADIQHLHYFRMKKAITEPDYKEVTLIDMPAWVSTADATQHPVESSLLMFEGVHQRYVTLINALTEEQWARSYFHPIRNLWFNQKQAVAMSAWHVSHHLAHIKVALGINLAD